MLNIDFFMDDTEVMKKTLVSISYVIVQIIVKLKIEKNPCFVTH